MHKLLLATSLIALPGLALAQEAQTTTNSTTTVATPPATATVDVAATVKTTAPATDARGIAVISAPAAAPSGANQALSVPAGAKVVAATNQDAVFTPVAATGDLPPCSKTVTDRCKQTYERVKKR